MKYVNGTEIHINISSTHKYFLLCSVEICVHCSAALVTAACSCKADCRDLGFSRLLEIRTYTYCISRQSGGGAGGSSRVPASPSVPGGVPCMVPCRAGWGCAVRPAHCCGLRRARPCPERRGGARACAPENSTYCYFRQLRKRHSTV